LKALKPLEKRGIRLPTLLTVLLQQEDHPQIGRLDRVTVNLDDFSDKL